MASLLGDQNLSQVWREICVTEASRLIEAAARRLKGNNLDSRANMAANAIEKSATNPQIH